MARGWENAYQALSAGDAGPLVRGLEAQEVDVVCLNETQWTFRGAFPIDGATVWAPFFRVRGPLVESRQFGLVPRPIPPDVLARQRAALEAALGPPVFEGDGILVFRNAR